MNIGLIIYGIIVLLYVITFIFIREKEKRDSVFLKISFLFLFIILAIREPYSDMSEYLKYFHWFHNMPLNQVMNFSLEPLFKLLTKFIGDIWFEDRFFISLIDFITIIGPYYFIKKYSKNYLLSVLLFVAIGSFSLEFYCLRQAIATSIILFSIKYIENNNFFKFFGMGLIAFLFHKSALFFLPIYFISKIKTKYQVFLSVIIFICIILFKDYLYGFIGLSFYSDYLGGHYDTQGEGYGKLILFIILLIFSALFYTRKEKQNLQENISKENSFNRILITLSIFTILIQLMSTRVSIMTRLCYYFSQSYIILPVNIINDMNKQWNKKTITIASMVVIAVYLYFILPISGYSTIFSFN